MRKEKEMRKVKKWRRRPFFKGKTAESESEKRERFFYFFFASFYDLQKSDRRFSFEQKAKSVHASRATCGYQNLGVSSNSTR